jgi:hypothetical protein
MDMPSPDEIATEIAFNAITATTDRLANHCCAPITPYNIIYALMDTAIGLAKHTHDGRYAIEMAIDHLTDHLPEA